ncbi:hypothetical protein BDN71DRAFT_1514689 [Pleurotus eryngii]|uniref:Uncharacterized protein n=1 Tax=Pleurotus eryngii TaxID=5323 RepID=A0A9P6D7K7_PLEER|nr:hypothetical protein BDN71DRAFT_1514689 [Pleurotus eryngii]
MLLCGINRHGAAKGGARQWSKDYFSWIWHGLDIGGRHSSTYPPTYGNATTEANWIQKKKNQDDEDVDEEVAEAAKGEVAGVGDGSDEDDKGNATIMDVDVIITSHKPAKCDASQSPLTGKHTSKA